MKGVLVLLLSLAAPAPAWAQHEAHETSEVHDTHDASATHDTHEVHETDETDETDETQDAHETVVNHEAHDQGVSPSPRAATAEPAPPDAFSGPVHAADTIFDPAEMAAARAQLAAEGGASWSYLVLADRFETRFADSNERYVWDLQGWFGGDIHKLWIKSEGEGALGDNPEDAEVQALYSRAITPFFDFQAGIRQDLSPDPQRTQAVLGVQGLLPQRFEIDAAAFLSEDGDLSGRVEAEYDLRVTQRLVLQPRIELDFAAQAIPEHGLGSGLGSVEGGLRLRYEIRREIAPYIGVAWQRKLGATADLARVAGVDRRRVEVVAGIRMWF